WRRLSRPASYHPPTVGAASGPGPCAGFSTSTHARSLTMTTSTNPPNQPFSTPRRRFAAIGALCLGAFALGTAFQAATATPAASRAVGPTSVAIVNLNRIAEGLDEMKEKL